MDALLISRNNRQVGLHALIWSLTFLALLLTLQTVDGFEKPDERIVSPLALGMVFSLIVFYGNSVYLAPKLAQNAHFLSYTTVLLIGLMVISALEAILDQVLYQSFHPYPKTRAWTTFYLPNLIINALVGLISFTYWSTRSWLQSERHRNELAEANLNAEIASLKSSIQPHFLFNSLNGIYSEALKSDRPKIAQMIASLADLMRHTVYQTEQPSIAISKEIQSIKDYISIWNYRVDHQFVKVKLDEKIEHQEMYIAPMLLLPLVENAFKHGIVPGKASQIEIQIDSKSAREMSFQVTNTLHPKSQAIEGTGFGLKNLMERLNLLYPNSHKFSFREENGCFVSKLQLHF